MPKTRELTGKVNSIRGQRDADPVVQAKSEVATADERRFSDRVKDQYLTFYVAGQVYGVAVLSVQQVVPCHNLAEIPMSPSAVKGVLHHNDMAIPVINLRSQFFVEEPAVARWAAILLTACTPADILPVGLMIDRIGSVVEIAGDQIHQPPNFSDSVNTEFIKGSLVFEGESIVILDIGRLMSSMDVLEVPQDYLVEN